MGSAVCDDIPLVYTRLSWVQVRVRYAAIKLKDVAELHVIADSERRVILLAKEQALTHLLAQLRPKRSVHALHFLKTYAKERAVLTINIQLCVMSTRARWQCARWLPSCT